MDTAGTSHGMDTESIFRSIQQSPKAGMTSAA